MASPARELLLIIFCTKFTSLLNSDDPSYRDGILECVTQSITALDLADVTITVIGIQCSIKFGQGQIR